MEFLKRYWPVFAVIAAMLLTVAFAIMPAKSQTNVPSPDLPIATICPIGATVYAEAIQTAQESGVVDSLIELRGDKMTEFMAALVSRLGPPPIDYTPDLIVIANLSIAPDVVKLGFASEGCLRDVFQIPVPIFEEIVGRRA